MKHLHRFLAIIALILPCAAQANDAALYDPAPPADAAFVRVINASGEAKVNANLSGISFSNVAYPEVSGYYVVKQGESEFQAGEKHEKVTIAPAKYYTIAVLPENKIKVFEDDLVKNPTKARVYFYNLSNAASASLYAPEHKADIISDVKPGESKSREVNALTLQLTIKADGKDAKALDKVILKRRAGYTAVVAGKKEDPKAFAVENSVQR